MAGTCSIEIKMARKGPDSFDVVVTSWVGRRRQSVVNQAGQVIKEGDECVLNLPIEAVVVQPSGGPALTVAPIVPAELKGVKA
jgi:hypothetical protein